MELSYLGLMIFLISNRDHSKQRRFCIKMQEFEYQINYDEKSYTIRKYKGDERNVIVPGTFGGKPVTIIFDSVFAGHDEIYSITFPDTITDLGEFVFDGCSNLKHIELPKSLASLWGYTFARSAIEEITLPDGVGIIPPYAFKDCKALKKGRLRQRNA